MFNYFINFEVFSNKEYVRKERLKKTIITLLFESNNHFTVKSLLHRPGKARRGDKVCIHFQLLGWFTSTSRQSPQVD